MQATLQIPTQPSIVSLPQHVFPPTNGAQPAAGVPPPVGVPTLNAPNPPFSSNSAISRGPQIIPQFNSMTSSRVHYQTNSGHPPAGHHRYIIYNININYNK